MVLDVSGDVNRVPMSSDVSVEEHEQSAIRTRLLSHSFNVILSLILHKNSAGSTSNPPVGRVHIDHRRSMVQHGLVFRQALTKPLFDPGMYRTCSSNSYSSNAPAACILYMCMYKPDYQGTVLYAVIAVFLLGVWVLHTGPVGHRAVMRVRTRAVR